jgi:zinc transport system ATP-binding protein
MTTAIAVRDGNIALGGRPVVRGVDLSIRRGEVVALLGSNGSGKTTLVRGLMGLVGWSSGDVQILGTPQRQFSQWHRLGYVPQQASANSGVPATVLEVVSSGRLSRRKLLLPLRRRDREAVQAALRAVELEELQHDAVSRLSGGQQQRVLIARALAGEPDLLVLDEPNAGVDHHNQLGLAATLHPMVEAGATVLLVLHEMGPLAELIDRVVVLRHGRVTYDGVPPTDDSLDEFHSHHHSSHQRDRSPLGSGPL